MALLRSSVRAGTVCGLAAVLIAVSAGCSEVIVDPAFWPRLAVEPATVEFEGVPVGAQREVVVLLRNTGDALLTLGTVGFAEDLAGPFEIELDRRVVPPNGVTQLSLRFRPRETGVAQALLRIEVEGHPEQTAQIAVRGTGLPTVPLEIEPREVDFGRVRRGTGAAHRIVVRNPHAAPLQLPAVLGPNTHVCGPTPWPTPFCLGQSDGRLSAERGLRLEAEEAVVVDAYFRPAELGPRSGHVSFGPCEGPGCGVTLRGVGVDDGLRCAPATVDFGAVNPGRCREAAVTCKNVANVPARLQGWRASRSPPTSPSFSFTASSTVSLEPGDVHTLTLRFCPTELGDESGRLEINTDVPTQASLPIELSGRGGGPTIEVAPSVCDFGRVALVTSARCQITVHNRGHDPLNISDVVAGSTDFTAPGAGAVSVAPGEHDAWEIYFQPSAVGAQMSTLRIRSNDRHQPDFEVTLRGEGVDLPSCAFSTTAGPIDLGLVPLMHAHRAVIELRNLGAQDCLLTGVGLVADSDAAFALDPTGVRRGDVLAAGAAALIPVDYHPQSLGEHRGAVTLDLSSRDRPFNRIELTGTSTDAPLLVAPRDLDFGVRGVGCRSDAQRVRIYNPGPEPVVLEAVTRAAPSPVFVVAGPQDGLPSTIAPGGFAELGVTFFAETTSAYADSTDLIVTVDGRPARYTVWSTGRGTPTPLQSDRFVQMPSSKVDVLFVLEFSGSMSQEQARLADHFTDFIRLARSQGIDYAIGVTTDGVLAERGRLMHPDRIRGNAFGGPLEDRIVTAATRPDPETVFARNVQATNLYACCSLGCVQALYASYLALRPANLLGPNRGFPRPEAGLAVVFVANNPDQSRARFDAPSSEADFYADFVRSMKPQRERDRIGISAIAGDVPDGCVGQGGNAAAAPRLSSLATRTGGGFSSVCSPDWGAMLGDLSRSVFGLRTRFPLSQSPTPGTLFVEVDGVPTPPLSAQGAEHWRHNPSTNTIDFSPLFTPEPGDEIVVRYTPMCR